MEVQFQGAAREVTGSCHLVRINGSTIMLDAGLFQGRRDDVRRKNEKLPVPPDDVAAVVLSHAHIDHAGRLPFLAKHGLRAPIFTTPATLDLSRVMLADAAHIQEKDARFLAKRRRAHQEPLYDMDDARRCVDLMVGVPYGQRREIASGIHVTLLDAGHILGSASVILDWRDGFETRRLAFSGDIGRAGLAIIRDPVPPTDVDAVIMESTYGGRDHISVSGARDALADVVTAAAARGGKVLIPAFAVGRTQELIYSLHELALQGRIPKIPVIVDSPLATEATAVFGRNAAVFDTSEPFVRLFGSDPSGVLHHGLVEFTESAEASKAAMQRRGPMVVIAASGMVESGRILHHLLHGASDPKNTILIVGFQGEHTLGRRIVERMSPIKVLGETVDVRANVVVLHGYSAHADHGGLLAWHSAVRATSPRLRKTWLVHGEASAQDAMLGALARDGVVVSAPSLGARAVL
ncbi:MAG: MBL fold metallo-hydrolase [Gemmatimonadetes bacterium]|nr:MBL fold metallo-hydrolase [Gemmatimonadota bacterium]